MAHASFTYTALEFDSSNTAKMQLFIVVGNFSFSYMIVANKEIQVLEKFNITVTKESLFLIYDEKQYLNQSFEKVTIANITAIATAIPNDLFHYNTKEILDIMYDEDVEEQTFCNDYCGTQQLQLVYRTNDATHLFLSQKHPNVAYKHLQTLLLNQLYNTAEQKILIGIIDHSFVLHFYKKNKLQLSKTIVADSYQSFLYNVIAFCELYTIDRELVEVELFGWVTENSPLHKELKNYFANVALLKNNRLYWNTEQIEAQYVVLYNYLYNSN